MNISDIQQCARYYQDNYIEKFYIITTYNDTSFILIGENTNFPHLVGIPRNIYNSNGYSKAKYLYNDILNNKPIPTAIIPNTISTTSKMYKKVYNFCNSTDLFWKNSLPLLINYNPNKSSSNLKNVDKLIIDCLNGYMLGCKDNVSIQISSDIHFKKYCISSWIDEKGNSQQQKEKYMPSQDIEIVKTVLALDKDSNLSQPLKKYSFDKTQKEKILRAVERTSSNLLINSRNSNNYIIIAKNNNIHCKINGIQY